MVVAITNQQQSLDDIQIIQGHEKLEKQERDQEKEEEQNSKIEIEKMSYTPVVPIMR